MAMKPVNVTARRLRDLHTIRRMMAETVDQLAKEKRCNVGKMAWRQERDAYIMTIENDGEIGLILSKHVEESAFGKLESIMELSASYDWPTDKYHRPISTIKFIFI